MRGALPSDLLERVLKCLGARGVEALRRACKWEEEVGEAFVRRQAALILDLDVPYTSIRQFSARLRDHDGVVRRLFLNSLYPSICLDAVSERLRGERGLMEALVDIDALVLQYASEDLRSDHAFVWRAIDSARRHAPPIAASGISLAWLPPPLRDAEDIARAVLMQKPMAAFLEMQHVSARLRADAAFVRFAVILNPTCLQYASEALRGDRSLVIWAMEAVSPRHRQMCDVVQLKWLSADLRDDDEIVKLAVDVAGITASYYFGDASARVRGNRSMVAYAVCRDPRCLHFATHELRGNKDLAILAASTPVKTKFDQISLGRLSAKLRRDTDVRHALANALVLT